MIGFFFFLVWPLAEIAGFIIVGREIGVLATLGLLFLSAIIGMALMRYQGFAALRRIQADARSGKDPARDAAHGLMMMVAGMLLVLPGFVSDIIGLALLVPPVRDLAWKFLKRRVNFAEIRVNRGFGTAGPSGREDGQTIDLDASDYQSTPNPDSPWKRVDDNKE